MGNKKAAVFIITAAAGIFLRFFNPGLKPVSPEEFETLQTALSGNILDVFFASLANTTNPPLFYLIQALFLKTAGVSEFSLRLFPAMVSVISLFVFYKLSRSFFSEKAATTAFIIFAFNPFQFYAGQQAAVYGLTQLSLMLCVYYFLMSVKYNSFTVGPFVFWTAVSLYTHNSALIVVAAMNILMFTYLRDEIRPEQWRLSQLLILLLWLPIAPAFVKNIALYEVSGGSAAALFDAVKTYIFGPAAPAGWLYAALTAAALWFILMGAVTRRRPMEKKIENTVVIIIGAVLGVPWLLSFATGFFDPYSLIIAAPFIILLFGLGISYMSEAGMAVFMALFLAFCGYSAVKSHTAGDFLAPEYRQAFSAAASGQGVIAHETRESYVAFEFYRIKHKAAIDNRVYGTGEAENIKGIALRMEPLWHALKEKLKLKIPSESADVIDPAMLEKLARSAGGVTIIKSPGTAVFPYPRGFEAYSQKDFRGVSVVVLKRKGGV